MSPNTPGPPRSARNEPTLSHPDTVQTTAPLREATAPRGPPLPEAWSGHGAQREPGPGPGTSFVEIWRSPQLTVLDAPVGSESPQARANPVATWPAPGAQSQRSSNRTHRENHWIDAVDLVDRHSRFGSAGAGKPDTCASPVAPHSPALTVGSQVEKRVQAAITRYSPQSAHPPTELQLSTAAAGAVRVRSALARSPGARQMESPAGRTRETGSIPEGLAFDRPGAPLVTLAGALPHGSHQISRADSGCFMTTTS
jgi:hypothetical protein